MKLFLHVVAVLLLIASTVACKKEKNLPSTPANTTKPDTPTCRIIKMIETYRNFERSDTMICEYDNAGRLILSHGSAGYTRRAFQYFNALIVVTVPQEPVVLLDSLFLTASGMIRRRADNYRIVNYTYNADDELIGSVISYRTGNRTLIGYYTWQHGNLMQYTLDSLAIEQESYTYTDISSPFASILNSREYFNLGAVSRKGSKLLKSSTYTDNTGAYTYNYSYEFDTDGKPIAISYNNGEIYRRIYYSCQ